MAPVNGAKPIHCVIESKEKGIDVKLEALFNPKELSISQSNEWSPSGNGARPLLELKSIGAKELSFELLFDTYESRLDVHEKYVSKLERLVAVIDENDPDKRRPPKCVFSWGNKFPAFTGVLESLSTKYTMFFTDGTPCRATCTIKMKNGDNLGINLSQDDDAASPGTRNGTTVQQGDEMRADRHGDNHRQVLANNGSDDGRLQPGQQVNSDPSSQLE